MNIKGIIFDLDGVIVFTDRLHYQAWKRVADKMNIPFDEKVNDRLRGVGRMESLDIILENCAGKELSKAEKEALAAEKNQYYVNLLGEIGPADVTKEVRAALADFRSRGIVLAIGSSSRNAKYILEQVKLLDAFDAISDGTNITRPKPDPEVFLKAAAFLHLAPEQCLVVEDACAGIDAAKAGGMKAAGMGDARAYKKTDYQIDKISDLLLHF